MKIVHAADLHIDSPLRGLARYEGAPLDRLRGATREAFTRLVDLVLAEEASLLLLAGDVFDTQWRDFSVGLFFTAQLARLRESGARVALVRGNHDFEHSVMRTLPMPRHVHVFPSSAPSSLVLEDLGVVVHGQSFPSRHVDVDLGGAYPTRQEGLLNVGLLHTSVDGRPPHARYAPTSLDVLRAKGYDYWALGHVHEREVLSRDPWIVFPGNLQGRHARELGPKGASVITVEDLVVRSVVHETLDVVRWARLEVDVSAARGLDDALDAVGDALRDAVLEADGRLLAARVELGGRSPFSAEISRDPAAVVARVRQLALDHHGDEVFVEKVSVQPATSPLAVPLFEDPLAADDLDAILRELDDLAKKLPPELADQLDWASDAGRADVIARAEALLRARLLEGR